MAIYHVSFDVDFPDPAYTDYLFWRGNGDDSLRMHSPVLTDSWVVENVTIEEVVDPE